MLFASDLDRTLIYSEKLIDDSLKKGSNIRLVETKNGEAITFMTEKVIEQLKIISKKGMFIPVTTRTIEQYKRISVFYKEMIPAYSVVSNGGNILINGRLNRQWNEIVKRKMGQMCLALEDVLDQFKEIHSPQWVYKLRVADELFFYCIVDESCIPIGALSSFSKILEKNNWRTVLHGRKLYFLPNCVNKRDAIIYIAEREKIEHIVAAGDSFIDLDMADIANHFISPCHGEIFNSIKDEKSKRMIQFTACSGIMAGDEILENAIKLLFN